MYSHENLFLRMCLCWVMRLAHFLIEYLFSPQWKHQFTAVMHTVLIRQLKLLKPCFIWSLLPAWGIQEVLVCFCTKHVCYFVLETFKCSFLWYYGSFQRSIIHEYLSVINDLFLRFTNHFIVSKYKAYPHKHKNLL